MRILPLIALAVAGTAIQAQAPTLSGNLQVWYSQMLDNNLRLNDAAKYTNAIRSEFRENAFLVRRSELKLAGRVTDEITGELLIDPSIPSSATNHLLQDVLLIWKPAKAWEVRIGQFKTQQTLEPTYSSSEQVFIDRSMLAAAFGDIRDRGATVSYLFGMKEGFAGKATVGAFNGAGKVADANAQKDFVARLDCTYGKAHRFGVYALQGGTDQPDKGALVARTFAGAGAPTAAQVLEDRDQTRQVGLFYQYTEGPWMGTLEAIQGRVGRRAAAVGTSAGAAGREFLGQRFLGWNLSGGYTVGHHIWNLRYDVLDWNAGRDWYGAANPYLSGGVDSTPKFTVATAGYTYAFNPAKVKAAKLSVNYIARSRNHLKPRPGQTGEQGGDSLVTQFQVTF